MHSYDHGTGILTTGRCCLTVFAAARWPIQSRNPTPPPPRTFLKSFGALRCFQRHDRTSLSNSRAPVCCATSRGCCASRRAPATPSNSCACSLRTTPPSSLASHLPCASASCGHVWTPEFLWAARTSAHHRPRVAPPVTSRTTARRMIAAWKLWTSCGISACCLKPSAPSCTCGKMRGGKSAG
jgi:hypothetical protein